VYFGHKKKKHAINNHEAKMENHIAFHHIYFIACDYPKYNQLPPCDAKKRPNFNNSTGNPNQKLSMVSATAIASLCFLRYLFLYHN